MAGPPLAWDLTPSRGRNILIIRMQRGSRRVRTELPEHVPVPTRLSHVVFSRIPALGLLTLDIIIKEISHGC